MSRHRARSSPDEKRSLVRLADDLARHVRVISSALGLTTTEYIDSRLRPVVAQEMPVVIRSISVNKAAPKESV